MSEDEDIDVITHGCGDFSPVLSSNSGSEVDTDEETESEFIREELEVRNIEFHPFTPKHQEKVLLPYVTVFQSSRLSDVGSEHVVKISLNNCCAHFFNGILLKFESIHGNKTQAFRQLIEMYQHRFHQDVYLDPSDKPGEWLESSFHQGTNRFKSDNEWAVIRHGKIQDYDDLARLFPSAEQKKILSGILGSKAAGETVVVETFEGVVGVVVFTSNLPGLPLLQHDIPMKKSEVFGLVLTGFKKGFTRFFPVLLENIFKSLPKAKYCVITSNLKESPKLENRLFGWKAKTPDPSFIKLPKGKVESENIFAYFRRVSQQKVSNIIDSVWIYPQSFLLLSPKNIAIEEDRGKYEVFLVGKANKARIGEFECKIEKTVPTKECPDCSNEISATVIHLSMFLMETMYNTPRIVQIVLHKLSETITSNECSFCKGISLAKIFFQYPAVSSLVESVAAHLVPEATDGSSMIVSFYGLQYPKRTISNKIAVIGAGVIGRTIVKHLVNSPVHHFSNILLIDKLLPTNCVENSGIDPLYLTSEKHKQDDFDELSQLSNVKILLPTEIKSISPQTSSMLLDSGSHMSYDDLFLTPGLEQIDISSMYPNITSGIHSASFIKDIFSLQKPKEQDGNYIVFGLSEKGFKVVLYLIEDLKIDPTKVLWLTEKSVVVQSKSDIIGSNSPALHPDVGVPDFNAAQRYLELLEQANIVIMPNVELVDLNPSEVYYDENTIPSSIDTVQIKLGRSTSSSKTKRHRSQMSPVNSNLARRRRGAKRSGSILNAQKLELFSVPKSDMENYDSERLEYEDLDGRRVKTLRAKHFIYCANPEINQNLLYNFRNGPFILHKRLVVDDSYKLARDFNIWGSGSSIKFSDTGLGVLHQYLNKEELARTMMESYFWHIEPENAEKLKPGFKKPLWIEFDTPKLHYFECISPSVFVDRKIPFSECPGLHFGPTKKQHISTNTAIRKNLERLELRETPPSFGLGDRFDSSFLKLDSELNIRAISVLSKHNISKELKEIVASSVDLNFERAQRSSL